MDATRKRFQSLMSTSGVMAPPIAQWACAWRIASPCVRIIVCTACGGGGVLPSGVNTANSDQIGGFSILQGRSLDDVTALLDGHPHFHSPDASIEVLECMQMPGMEGWPGGRLTW